MSDIWNTLAANFGGFDGYSFVIMAIILVGAAVMMPTIAAIVTATCGALFVFGVSVFLRSVLAAKDASSVAHADLDYALTLQLRTLAVYGAVFCFTITAIYGFRMLLKHQ